MVAAADSIGYRAGRRPDRRLWWRQARTSRSRRGHWLRAAGTSRRWRRSCGRPSTRPGGSCTICSVRRTPMTLCRRPTCARCGVCRGSRVGRRRGRGCSASPGGWPLTTCARPRRVPDDSASGLGAAGQWWAVRGRGGVAPAAAGAVPGAAGGVHRHSDSRPVVRGGGAGVWLPDRNDPFPGRPGPRGPGPRGRRQFDRRAGRAS